MPCAAARRVLGVVDRMPAIFEGACFLLKLLETFSEYVVGRLSLPATKVRAEKLEGSGAAEEIHRAYSSTTGVPTPDSAPPRQIRKWLWKHVVSARRAASDA